MPTMAEDEIRRRWVTDRIWDEVEAAYDVIDAHCREGRVETGGDGDALIRLIEQRARPGTRLAWAFKRIWVYEHVIAHALADGWEPVPGQGPGVMQLRPDGPLPLAEQQQLAAALGISPELLETDDGADGPED